VQVQEHEHLVQVQEHEHLVQVQEHEHWVQVQGHERWVQEQEHEPENHRVIYVSCDCEIFFVFSMFFVF
jgi:hypothetical protein